MNPLDALLSVLNFVGRKLNGGKPFSRKVVVGLVTAVGLWVASFAVAHGVHVPAFFQAIIPAIVAFAAGAVAAWLAKEDPALFSDSAGR